MLLKGHPLSDKMTFLGLLAACDFLLDLKVVFNAPLLVLKKFAAGSNCIHVISLEQVIKRVKIEALVEQLKIHILGQAHQTHSLVLDLGDECLVFVALGSDQLSNEILAIGLRDSLGLRVKYICKIIVIFLFGDTDLNER